MRVALSMANRRGVVFRVELRNSIGIAWINNMTGTTFFKISLLKILTFTHK